MPLRRVFGKKGRGFKGEKHLSPLREMGEAGDTEGRGMAPAFGKLPVQHLFGFDICPVQFLNCGKVLGHGRPE